MKPLITLLASRLLTQLAVFAQAKPEVTNPPKVAKRAW